MNDSSHVLKRGMKGYFSVFISYILIYLVFLFMSFVFFFILEAFVPIIVFTLLFWGANLIFAYFVSLGLAYIVYQAVSKEDSKVPGVFSVFKREHILKNAMYLFIRFAVFLVVFLIAYGGVQMLAESIVINFGWTGLIVFAVLALLPLMILAMLLSMVPYLLADPDFNQQNNNPLLASVGMLKRHYITVFSLRFIFLLWYAWIFIGASIYLIFTLEEVSMYLYGTQPLMDWGLLDPIMNDEVLRGRIFGVLGYSLLATPFIMPIYRVMHGVLYAKLRYKTIPAQPVQDA